MKAIQVIDYGGPEVAKIQTIASPSRSANEVLVRVVASSINPVDIKHMTPNTIQKISQFPAVLGWDVTGVVIEADQDSEFKPGDRVIAMHPQGSWQQIVAIAESDLVKLPDAIDFVSGASIPLAAVTALQAIRKLQLEPSETLLVTGATGSVGGYAIQIAKQEGIPVAGLVRNNSQKEIVKQWSVDGVYTSTEKLPAFDAVFDTAGILDQTDIIVPGGKLITISDDAISSEVEEHASFAEHNYVRTSQEDLQYIIDLILEGQLQTRIAENYTLNDVQPALKHANQSGNNSKVVITF
ncbi:NADP-dependent oxidoreductase [Tetragenococcus koreensis]|uniref:NADP-dependent oxidoreductase n=1 Tax=Tetragenococcus koreensis TaxID=290335 RepID=UPI001F351A89|nr:NADP-dependent oxidoreductase [Tetragenococcus koreensis]MCF1632052.1 NADP-dependent oxidoreductase [Tetragenococcus koreensis]